MNVNLNLGENFVKKNLFGGEVKFVVEDSDSSSLILDEIILDSYEEGLRLQKIFNFYDAKSELSKLNKKRVMQVSDELLSVIKQGLKYSELSFGEYDISLGKVILARKDSGETLERSTSYKDIKIGDNVVELNSSDAFVDLGSIAKGYIVDEMVKVLVERGVSSGLINGRGDIRVFGEREQVINIQHPRDKNKFLKRIVLKNKSIATSGDYNQFFGSEDKPHIVNNKDLVSVTVIADSLMEADAFATILFVSDRESRERIAKNEKISALLVDKDLNVECFNGFEEFVKNEE